MISRRGFLGWAGLVAGGLLAHHKPGHPRGPAPTTTTTTTTVPPLVDFTDAFTDAFPI